MGNLDDRLERAIDALLDDRRAGASICPTQTGEVVDVATARGPVRVRRSR